MLCIYSISTLTSLNELTSMIENEVCPSVVQVVKEFEGQISFSNTWGIGYMFSVAQGILPNILRPNIGQCPLWNQIFGCLPPRLLLLVHFLQLAVAFL